MESSTAKGADMIWVSFGTHSSYANLCINTVSVFKLRISPSFEKTIQYELSIENAQLELVVPKSTHDSIELAQAYAERELWITIIQGLKTLLQK